MMAETPGGATASLPQPSGAPRLCGENLAFGAVLSAVDA